MFLKGLLISILLIINISLAQETLDISVKGISDGKNDGAQKDRMEAIMDAKRQACEKAGMKIESKTTVENFQVVYDFIESQAEAILLPDFTIMDIGYVQDGTYQVVLIGKIMMGEDDEGYTELILILKDLSSENRYWTYGFGNMSKDYYRKLLLELNELIFLFEGEPFQRYEEYLLSIEGLKIPIMVYYEGGSNSGIDTTFLECLAYKFRLPEGLLEQSTIDDDEYGRFKKMLLSKTIYVSEKSKEDDFFPRPIEFIDTKKGIYTTTITGAYISRKETEEVYIYPTDFTVLYDKADNE